jgi:transcriptional regulator with XRE-family HTH domain
MDDTREQFNRQFDTGEYLAEIRASKKIRLTDAARSIGISAAYLKEIEKGLKLPSDILIRAIADYYQISEDELFRRWGKIPLLAREQFNEMPDLQKVLADVRKQKISEDEKQHILDEVTQLYKKFLQRISKESDGDE